MNKKDIQSLMEAYDEIASVEVSPEENISDIVDHEVSMGAESPEEHLHEMEDEKKEMVETRLRSIIAHAHQALDAIQKGSVIEPWMQDLIAISSENIVKTSNSLVYKHEG